MTYLVLDEDGALEIAVGFRLLTQPSRCHGRHEEVVGFQNTSQKQNS